ncbi:MAG: type II toxin-antitoxin system PemK/MazF family toxin [Candidatus Binatota bacterium]
MPHGLAVSGVVLADQAKSLDWRARKAELICALPEAMVTEVLQKLSTLL